MTLSWFPASEVGGVNQAVLNLARVMLENGSWQPLLLVTCETEIPASHPHIVCPVESLYLRPPDSLRSILAFLAHLPTALFRLTRLLRASDVRIVSCHFPDNESVHFALLRRLRLYQGKLVLSFHGEDIRILSLKTALGRSIARWMMRNADAVVACSHGLLRDLVTFEPACNKHAAVIYNAIDIDKFTSGIEKTFVLPDVLQGKRFLLNVARYEYKKGQDILIKAFDKIAAEFPDLMLLMIGTSVGQESANVRSMVDQSPVSERILMLENIPHTRVGAFMQAAEIFVLPSRREGFPFVLLEAGAMRLPVVAAACLGVPEIIQDGETGRLVPVEDADALANAIGSLLRDKQKRRRYASQLHDLVARDFSWKTAYQKHVNFVEAPCE
jgi:glycosyltransferase involved in cell wall biosynthesis